MADYVTLKFSPEIKGEETVAGHDGEISIQNFSMGGNRSVDMSMLKAGNVASDVHVQMSFSKESDVASADLWNSFLTGKKFDSATLYVLRNIGGSNVETYLELTLSHVYIADMSYVTTNGDPGRGQENFSLVAGKMKGRASEKNFSWDFLKGQP